MKGVCEPWGFWYLFDNESALSYDTTDLIISLENPALSKSVV